MALLLPTMLDESSVEHHPFILVQSTSTRSALPILRRFLSERLRTGQILLLCTLYSPEELLKEHDLKSACVFSINWTNFVAGYTQLSWENKQIEVKKTLEKSAYRVR